MNGSQAQLEFLPERSTDFIFAVIGEEWGLVGCLVLMSLYMMVIARGLYIASQAQDTFSRLIAGSLTLTFCGVRVRQQRHGRGPAAGGRRAAAARQLRRHVAGDPHGRVRYPHVRTLPPQAGLHVTRTRPRTNRAHGPWSVACLAPALVAFAPGYAHAFDAGREDVAAFVADMSSKHGFDADSLRDLLGKAESRQSVLDAMTRPAEKALSWQEYRERFITERRVNRGVETLSRSRGRAREGCRRAAFRPNTYSASSAWRRSTARSRAETVYSTRLRRSPSTYAARAPFFRGELEQFLLMTREEALDPLTPLGSYAGAMGMPQFMPSSFRSYAVDGDDDGHRDLWNDWSDVVSSVANYFKEHGWKPGEPVMAAADVSGADLAGLDTSKPSLTETVGSLRRRGVHFEADLPPDSPAMLIALSRPFGSEYRVGFANFYAITRYNRSLLYASAVNDLAESIKVARARSRPPDDDVSFAE